MKAKILLVEGKSPDRPSFTSSLTRKGYLVESVPNGSTALEHLEQELPNLVIIDSSTMRTSGRRICQAIRQKAAQLPIVLILNEGGPETLDANTNLVLALPFTPQKLLNRIRPYLPTKPKDLLQAGPIELDTRQHLVRCNGHQTRLTPRLTNLLRLLIERAGIAITRDDLFRLVWDTNYVGDTRTLDVHISWLRHAIEEDVRHPEYLKTIRGIGYRLDVEPAFRPSMESGTEPHRRYRSDADAPTTPLPK